MRGHLSKDADKYMIMKRLLILCLLLFFACGCSFITNCSDDPACEKILFIGNSYTFVNNLPDVFTRLAESGGHRVETGMSASGGWTLADHANSSETLKQINSQKWNFVILQEQSQIPANQSDRNNQMYPAARTLAGKIRAAGAVPVLFMTWAHRDGWPENGIPTYESMQLQINEGYLMLGQELKVRIAPVGYAWMEMRQQNPQFNLWQDDGIHPNEKGTYFAACVFYAAIYGESPEGLSYRFGLSKGDAQLLQKIAAEIVLKNTERWNIP